MTISVENFVKTILKQSKLIEKDTRLGTIAGLLNITNSAATDMARKLSLKGLVNYTKYKPLTLTDDGLKLALNVIRKHRLWESFLFKTLKLSLHEIHREAEQLEHQTSDFLAGKIEKYLDFPVIDPHGDPIPDADGKIEADNLQVLLSEAEAGNLYKVSRLLSSEKDFFEFCSSNDICIGSTIWIEKHYRSNTMTEVIINQDKIILNEEFTNIIYVKLTKQR